MMWEHLIPLLVGIVAGFGSWWIGRKRILMENVTQERSKWRENIRKKALFVHDAIMDSDGDNLLKLQCEFRALLNPCDNEDLGIVKSITLCDTGGSKENQENHAKEFSMRISYLLKHDWERAKREASFFTWGCFRYTKVKRCKFNSKCYLCESSHRARTV